MLSHFAYSQHVFCSHLFYIVVQQVCFTLFFSRKAVFFHQISKSLARSSKAHAQEPGTSRRRVKPCYGRGQRRSCCVVPQAWCMQGTPGGLQDDDLISSSSNLGQKPMTQIVVFLVFLGNLSSHSLCGLVPRLCGLGVKFE